MSCLYQLKEAEDDDAVYILHVFDNGQMKQFDPSLFEEGGKFVMKYLYETAVYDGAMKYWRILNLNTGTVYSSNFPTIEKAEAAIDEDAVRDGKIVKRVAMNDIRFALSVLPTLRVRFDTTHPEEPLPG